MFKHTIALAVPLLFGAVDALAADATLTFTGTIILPTCTVVTGSGTQTVALDTAKTTDFAAVGSVAQPKAFNIKLSNCTANTNVTMTVSGTTDTVASVLKNTGTATQVGIQLLKATNVGDITGTNITINSALGLGTVDATSAMTIPLVAQYYRLGTMTAGTVASSATVNFSYN